MTTLSSFSFCCMGSPCSLHLYARTPEEAKRVALRVQAEVARIEDRYSRYRTDSLLNRINAVAARGGSIELDEETTKLFAYARSCYVKSDGLFDITSGVLRRAWDFSSGRLPESKTIQHLLQFVGTDKVDWDLPRISFRVRGMEIDLGGIGKEYAADRAAVVCEHAKIKHGFIDLGGDIRIFGPHPDGAPWKIGIRNPFQPDAAAGTIESTGGAVATSGDYQRRIIFEGKSYGHLLDPRTGWPVEGLVSVTVIADQCLVAGSLTTVTMLRGQEGKSWLAGLNPGLRYLWIDTDGKTGGTLAAGFSEFVRL